MIENNGIYSIGTVERDTGIGRDTLRIRERRYGFPEPLRNDKGERVYSEMQLRRLQRIRRLLDRGLRPGKLLPMDDAGLDDVRSDRLPIEQLEFDTAHHALLFRAGGNDWRCDLQTYELRRIDDRKPVAEDGLAALPAENAPRASTRTGAETAVTFVNRTRSRGGEPL